MTKWSIVMEVVGDRPVEHVRTSPVLTASDRDKLARVWSVIWKAIACSGCNSTFVLRYDDQQLEPDTHAITSWPFLTIPIIRLLPSAFDQSDDDLGITIAHELVHCKQGWWRVFRENFTWAILRRSGFPPIELEAQEMVNKWPRTGRVTTIIIDEMATIPEQVVEELAGRCEMRDGKKQAGESSGDR